MQGLFCLNWMIEHIYTGWPGLSWPCKAWYDLAANFICAIFWNDKHSIDKFVTDEKLHSSSNSCYSWDVPSDRPTHNMDGGDQLAAVAEIRCYSFKANSFFVVVFSKLTFFNIRTSARPYVCMNAERVSVCICLSAWSLHNIWSCKISFHASRSSWSNSNGSPTGYSTIYTEKKSLAAGRSVGRVAALARPQIPLLLSFALRAGICSMWLAGFPILFSTFLSKTPKMKTG